MARLAALLLAGLCVTLTLSVAVAQGTPGSESGSDTAVDSSSTIIPDCTYSNLGFNPWQRWNAFALTNIGESAAPVSYFFTGRTASAASSYFRPIVAMAVGPSIHISGLGDNSTTWSATVGGEFFLSGGGTGFGGIEAKAGVTLQATTIHGDVNSAQGPISIGAGGVGYAAAVLGDVRSPSVVVGDGSTIYGNNLEGEAPALSVDLGKVVQYVQSMSIHYLNMLTAYVSFEYHGDPNTASRIELAGGVNVVKLSMEKINAMSKFIITGDQTGILVINAAGDLSAINLPKICFDEDCVTQPATGRVLINFYEATAFEISVTSNAFISILAPKAVVSIHSGGVWGNLMVKKLGAQTEQGQVVNVYHLPWGDDANCGVVEPGQPGTGPQECGAMCAWVNMLPFDPWQQWNLFSFGNIGTQELPFGAIIQGRVAAIGHAWFNAITLHSDEAAKSDDAEASGESTDDQDNWSVTVGGNFTLLGGSVKNGGVEAGMNILVQAADVDGDLTAVQGSVEIGTPNNAATITGKARAAVRVTLSQGSNAQHGVDVNPAGLALSVDLDGVGDFFKKQSLDFSTANSAPNSVSFSPNEANPSDIIVDLHAGLNFIALTPRAFMGASRLQLKGDASGVLVINIAGTTAEMDGLDVYENDWTMTPTKGRVLVNFYEAAALSVNWGSGMFSVVAPLADVVYKSGTFSGNWVVGSLRSQWAGGTQINALPWQAPCVEEC